MPGKPAARMGDATVHGGAIAFGAPTVLIGGMPAARVGDPHLCSLNPPLMPHVGGWLAIGSATVLVGGAPAARQGDLAACCVAPVSLPPVPTAPPETVTVTPPPFVPQYEVGYEKSEDVDLDGDGFAETHKREGAALRETSGEDLWGFFRYSKDKRYGFYEGEGRFPGVEGPDDRIPHFDGEAGAFRDVNTFQIGDEANPFLTVENTRKAASAEVAGHEPLLGTDGRGRYGIGGRFGGKGSLASEKIKTKSDLAVIPLLTAPALAARKFAGVNADMTGSASVSGGSGGLIAGGFLYYEDGRINWSLEGKVGILGVGVSFEVGASAGVMEGRELLDYFRDDPVTIDPALVELLFEKAKAMVGAQLLAAVPNAIALGCPTVLIGG